MRTGTETGKGRKLRATREPIIKGKAPAIRFRRAEKGEGPVDPPRLNLVQAYLRTMGVPKA